MAIVQHWLPPSRENWELVCRLWCLFPIVSLFVSWKSWASLKLIRSKFTALQWVISWYGQGKTSKASRFNIPGKIAWATMEAPGFITLLYIMYNLPKELGIAQLPWGNWIMAGCFVCALLA